MKTAFFLLACALVMTPVAWAYSPDTTCVDTFYTGPGKFHLVVCHELCVKWRSDTPHDTVAAMEAILKADSLSTAFSQWVLYDIDEALPLEDAVLILKSSSWVLSAHPDLVVHPCMPYMPEDNLWEDQDKYLGSWPNDGLWTVSGREFNLTKAWALSRGSGDCLINIIDTGSPRCPATLECQIEPCRNHPDFWSGETFRCEDFYSAPHMPSDHLWEDIYGHGTIMTGLVGAYHNPDGIAGINDHSRILISKVYNRLQTGRIDDTEPGGGAYVVAPAIEALCNSPYTERKVVLYAFATYQLWESCDDFDFSFDQATVYEDAIHEAYEHDILLVFPTGYGDSPGIGMPAIFASCGSREDHENGYPNVIAVGAYDLNGQPTTNSPGGALFTLRGPGGSEHLCWQDEQTPYGNADVRCATIHESANANGCVLGTLMREGCQEWSWSWYAGTSAAAAHVAGLASLVWSTAPDLPPARIRQAIVSTCFNLDLPEQGYRGRTDQWGYGAPNCLAAILAAESANDLELIGDLYINHEIQRIEIDPEPPLEVNRDLVVAAGKTLRFAQEDGGTGLLTLLLKAGKEIRVQEGGIFEIYQNADPEADLDLVLEAGARIVVQAGGSMNITSISGSEAVVQLRCRPGAAVVVQSGGHLSVQGTETSPIVFRSDDGVSTWDGIKVNGGELHMEYAEIYDAPWSIEVDNPAGSSVPVDIRHTLIDASHAVPGQGGLRLWGSPSLTQKVENCVIENSNGCGMYLFNCRVDFDSVTVRNCSYVNSYLKSMTGSFRYCTFEGRTSNYAVLHSGPTCTPNYQCCTFKNMAPPSGYYQATIACASRTSPSFGAENAIHGVSNVIDDDAAMLLTLS